MKAAVMIDGPNLYWSLEKMNKNLDYFQLIMLLEEMGFDEMILEFFYDKSTPGPIRDNEFLNFLKDVGFTVREVRKKSYTNGDRSKSRTDQAVTVRAMEHLYESDFDVLILFSGDSDFEELVLACRRKHKKIFIFATSESLSWELEGEADKVVRLDRLKADSRLFYQKKS